MRENLQELGNTAIDAALTVVGLPMKMYWDRRDHEGLWRNRGGR